MSQSSVAALGLEPEALLLLSSGTFPPSVLKLPSGKIQENIGSFSIEVQLIKNPTNPKENHKLVFTLIEKV